MSARKTVAAIIRNARIESGLTQLEVAKKAGVHPNTIAKIERGIQEPSYSTLKQLAKVLDIDLNKLPA